jgi:hypothetical protein
MARRVADPLRHQSDERPTPATGVPVRSHTTTRRRPGRPRLTPEDWSARLADYCRRYDVSSGGELPPFPSGRRETAQHREWMSLYKAHRRLSGRGPDPAGHAQRQELLTAQRGRCPVCRKPLDLEEARLDDWKDPAVVHAPCLELLVLARRLGPEGLERVRARI